MAEIILANSLFGGEIIFNHYISKFRDLIDLCRELLQLETDKAKTATIVFTFDVGVIPPLFWAASRCRDHVISREAMNILSKPHSIEGPWSSIVAAGFAKQIVAVENAGVDLRTCADVPPQNRIRKFKVHSYSGDAK